MYIPICGSFLLKKNDYLDGAVIAYATTVPCVKLRVQFAENKMFLSKFGYFLCTILDNPPWVLKGLLSIKLDNTVRQVSENIFILNLINVFFYFFIFSRKVWYFVFKSK